MFAEFFQENIFFFAALLVLVVLLLIDLKKNSLGGVAKVFPSKVPLLQRQGDLFILDVSPQKAFENGHIADSVNIPANTFSVENKLLKAEHSQPVLVVCQSGMNAGSIAKKLKTAGFEKVSILDGGIMGWQKDNFPLIKG